LWGYKLQVIWQKKWIEKLNIIVEIWNLTSNYNLWLQCKSYMCIEMIYLKVSNIQQVLYISITVLCHQHTIFSHIPPHILLMCHHLQPWLAFICHKLFINIFSSETTANLNQRWPKFIQNYVWWLHHATRLGVSNIYRK
jgi:hypothetical protein